MSKEQFNIKPVAVETDDWGVVYIHPLSGLDWCYCTDDSDCEGFDERRKNLRVSAKFFAVSVCDEQGNNTFTLDDIDQIERFPMRGIDTVVKQIYALNGMND